jgi:hypothetical protein
MLCRPFVEEVDVDGESGSSTVQLAGQAISVSMHNDGYLVWQVRFGNDKVVDMQCERLA